MKGYILILLILCWFLKFYGLKKGFDQLETYWISKTILFIILAVILPSNYKLVLLVILIRVPFVRACVLTILGVFYTAFSGKGFPAYRNIASYLYHTEIGVRGNLQDIPTQPTIFLANYPTNYLEYLVHGLLGEKVCLMMHGPAVKVVKYIYGKKYIIAVHKGHFDKLQENINIKLQEGYHVFAYIERDYYNRKNEYDVTEFRTGMFKIAKNIGATITPLAIDHIGHSYGILDDTRFKIKVGETKYVNNVNISLKETRSFIKKELRRMKIKTIT